MSFLQRSIPRLPLRAYRLALAAMGMEFGWWDKDEEGKKWQINVRFHGGNVVFSRKHGHHTSWEDFDPTDEQWDRLLSEAERRLPRRLMSQKEFDQLKAQRPD